MPGRQRTNFRSGNLAEHLGLLLLKGIAAVADVPRTEDVGLDAVATLLRRDLDGNSYAEDSFVVQLKSESYESIDYSGHQLRWFLAQSQPMFIGLVARREARISLYPTLRVNQAVLALHADQVKLLFSNPGTPYPWAGGSEDSVTVWLGPPLLSWALDVAHDEDWADVAYGVLKRYLSIAGRERILLSLGQSSQITWETNDQESIRSAPGIMKGHPGGFDALARDCMPNLKALMLQAHAMPPEQGRSMLACLLGVVASLRKLGIEPDPVISGFFERVYNVQVVITEKCESIG